MSACDIDSFIGRAIVDHQPLDGIETGHLARQFRQHRGELIRLVEAGNLDDEFASCLSGHCSPSPSLPPAPAPLGGAMR